VIQSPDLIRKGALMAFGDIRVAERADWLIERIAAVGSVVLRKVGETRAGEMAVHRFLSSRYVSADTIVATLSARTAEQCRGRRILAVQDTSEVNFSGRDKKRRGLGPAGDGKTPGFFIHPVIAVDIESEAMIGLVDAQIWTRPKRKQKRGGRRFEEKESARWAAGHKAAAERLSEAASLIMVSDRESDIYEVFVERPAGADLIVRAAQDRCLADDDGKLFAAVTEAPRLATTQVRVAPKPGEKERFAEVELRASIVSLVRPRDRPRRGTPASVSMTYVEAREVNPPSRKTPLLWRLLTTLPVSSAEQATEIVNLYRLRWRIEQLFRALKSDGLALEDTQVIDAERLFKLTAIALAAAVRTSQLVDARDGSQRPISDVIDKSFLPALQRLSRKLEGATAKQKNPHPPHDLSFLSWIAARLGGWNCYYGKPGPKTMHNGWKELAAMLAGYVLATHEEFP
jgi:Transposase DDE domain